MACYPHWHDRFRPFRGLRYSGGYSVPAPESVDPAVRAAGMTDFVPFDPAVLRANAEKKLRAAGLWRFLLPLSQNAYSLARNIATETGRGSAEQKVAMGLSTVNAARRRGVSVHALIVQNNRFPNRYGRIHDAGDTSKHSYGRFTASSQEPTAEDIQIAKFILDGGAGTFPDDFARGADDQAQVRTPGWVRKEAAERDYWVGEIPGVDPSQVTLFRHRPDIAPDSPEGQALLTRALTMLSLPTGEFPASCVDNAPASTGAKIFAIGAVALAASATVVWWSGRKPARRPAPRAMRYVRARARARGFARAG